MLTLNTYVNYCEKPYSLKYDQMQSIHEEMLAEIGNDTDAIELYEELIEVVNRYAAIRASWMLLSNEQKMETDSSRTACHNSVIVHFNMLSRYLRMQGKEANWRDRLGYEEDDKYYRKTIGDFACYLAFINGICAR